MKTNCSRSQVPAAGRIYTLALSALLAAGSGGQLGAAVLDFSGQLQAGNLTAIPWVSGSTMWGSIETGSGTGISQSGFSYFTGRDAGLFGFTFGDLELTSFQSPGPTSLGFERYTEGDGSVLPFTISYNGAVIATGTSDYLYDEVDNQFDFTAVGDGQVTLTAPGADPAFYNEVLALTGGTGVLQVGVNTFNPVNAMGLFATTGTLTAVPEPEQYAVVAAGALAGLALWRRSRRPAR